eukprot:1801031-Amphidinium_carterae.1
MPVLTKKMVAKLHPEVPFDWADVTIKGFTMWLFAYVDSEAVSELVYREGSITFLLHHTLEDSVLRQSGQRLWMVKTHAADVQEQLHLLWLADDTTWQRAAELAESDPKCLGLAVKKAASQVRHALRFREHDAFAAAAARHGQEEQINKARFKITGIDSRMGIAGIYQVLEERAGYQLDEVVYHSGNSCVVHAASVGLHRFTLKRNGLEQPVEVKAVNAPARAMVAAHNQQQQQHQQQHNQQTAQQPAATTPLTCAQRQRAIAGRGRGTAGVPPEAGRAPPPPAADEANAALVSPPALEGTAHTTAAEPATPRTGDRRAAPDHTGATPESQRQRTA